MDPKKLSILAIQKIRKSLEYRLNENLIRDENFINYMKYLLQCDGNEAIQIEAAWIFTNIAAGTTEQTKIVVEVGVIQLLIRLLPSSNKDLVEQSIWGLGNIVGDNPVYRDLVLQHGALKPLLSLVREGMKSSFQRTIVWVFVNIVRSRERPLSVELLKEVVPKLCLLATRNDLVTKIDALWALIFISDCGDDYIELIMENDIIRHIIPLLTTHNNKLQVTAMRFLGNIATGTDEQTQALLDNGLLENLRHALLHHNRNFRRISLWCLSNITIGTQDQAQEVFHSGLIPNIVDNLYHMDISILKEAVLTVRNLVNGGSQEQIIEFFDNRAVTPLINLIKSMDNDIAHAAYQALTILFTKGGLLVQKIYRLFQEVDSNIDVIDSP